VLEVPGSSGDRSPATSIPPQKQQAQQGDGALAEQRRLAAVKQHARIGIERKAAESVGT
jgi:hypothetical protein